MAAMAYDLALCPLTDTIQNLIHFDIQGRLFGKACLGKDSTICRIRPGGLLLTTVDAVSAPVLYCNDVASGSCTSRSTAESDVLLSGLPFSDCSKSRHVWGRANALVQGDPPSPHDNMSAVLDHYFNARRALASCALGIQPFHFGDSYVHR